VVKTSPARIPMAARVNTPVNPPAPPTITSTDWQIGHGRQGCALNQSGKGCPSKTAAKSAPRSVSVIIRPVIPAATINRLAASLGKCTREGSAI
jgi:hypothetical protein